MRRNTWDREARSSSHRRSSFVSLHQRTSLNWLHKPWPRDSHLPASGAQSSSMWCLPCRRSITSACSEDGTVEPRSGGLRRSHMELYYLWKVSLKSSRLSWWQQPYWIKIPSSSQWSFRGNKLHSKNRCFIEGPSIVTVETVVTPSLSLFSDSLGSTESVVTRHSLCNNTDWSDPKVSQFHPLWTTWSHTKRDVTPACSATLQVEWTGYMGGLKTYTFLLKWKTSELVFSKK